ncbi:hypothetical protein [Haloarchaeobius iranensis]|uniref:Uncharacterized protein n=1 Tax=Haloarchaeobius iranensis TaxID=996166 RepID=A0A1G9YRK0_9EURY|nr:hypothetical protein [Haloarchaeobius iranensis]SDN11091.1 hypothetical protein SAMN05192554_11579 [Haloarchaeobius iranensis]
MRPRALSLLLVVVVLLAGCSAVTPDGTPESTTEPAETPVEPTTATETPTSAWTPGGTGARVPDSNLVRLSVAARNLCGGYLL